MPIKNRPPGQALMEAARIVSPDALALVRFGLRSADDPRIQDTVKVIDRFLKADTPRGPAWYRYNDDGYGEHDDGSPFDGTGTGRPWPLITGERAHFELAAGRKAEAERLCAALESFAGEGGLLPEQIWDGRDIPACGLFPGRPSGSAMPLVWAHAEYVKLRRSLRDGRVFDMPPQTVRRYLVEKRRSSHAVWRANQKRRAMPAGTALRIETLTPAVVRWTTNGQGSAQETRTRPTGLGMYAADLPAGAARPGEKISFTLRPQDGGEPEERYWVSVSQRGSS